MNWRVIDIATGKILAVGKFKSEANRKLLERQEHGDFGELPCGKTYQHPVLFIHGRLTATEAASIRFAQSRKMKVSK